MPGLMTLGCVLGRYDHVQGWDVASTALTSSGTGVGSWSKLTSGNSVYLQSTSVHSSGQGVRIEVYSDDATGGSELWKYPYKRANDAYARWFPDITTHNFRIDTWARANDAAGSGSVRFSVEGVGQVPIPHASDLQPLRFFTVMTSGGDQGEGEINRIATVDSFAVFLDSWVAQADWINLSPDEGFEEVSPILAARHGALSGARSVYRWHRAHEWNVPLSFLSDSHAGLLNWWWRNQFTLAFTLDTSDANTLFLCRMVNEEQPMSKKISPYDHNWQGVLRLASINDGSLIL
jgi:hypothetical protein